MFTKFFAAVLTAVLAYMVVRKMTEWQNQSKVKVRTQKSKRRITRLRQDPKTGVYYPDED